MRYAKTWCLLAVVLLLASACTQSRTSIGASPASPVIAQIQQRGMLVVGTTGGQPPLNMTDRNGRVIGLEADLARYIADAMGVELKLEVMPFAALLGALESGKVDMILSGMTITPARNLKVAFVGPYFISGKAILTKSQTLAQAQEPTDINGPANTLTALQGSTSESFIKNFMPDAPYLPAVDYDTAVGFVLQDRAQAMIADYPICLVSLLRYPDSGLVSIITTLTYEPIGIALPAGDPLLINWLENFLNGFEGSGKMDELQQRWFESSAWLEKLP